MKNILKILTALAAVAGAVYLIATYGEQIVSWCKKLWSKMPQCPVCEEADVEAEVEAEIAEEAEAAEEAVAEEIPVEAAEEEAPEVIVAENEPVAAEEDFAE